MNGKWQLPDKLDKADGTPRRVGIEIELQGIDANDLAELTAETLGGTVDRVSSVEFNIDVPDLGEFRVEVDFKLLKDLAREGEGRGDDDDDGLMNFAVELLGGASAVLVPCEIVTPPIPMQSMAEPMDALVERLRAAGAKGTRHSVLYAFGVHLNVEPPDLEAGAVPQGAVHRDQHARCPLARIRNVVNGEQSQQGHCGRNQRGAEDKDQFAPHLHNLHGSTQPIRPRTKKPAAAMAAAIRA